MTTAEEQIADIQFALSGWSTDPEGTIRQIAKIVGYYIPEPDAQETLEKPSGHMMGET